MTYNNVSKMDRKTCAWALANLESHLEGLVATKVRWDAEAAGLEETLLNVASNPEKAVSVQLFIDRREEHRAENDDEIASVNRQIATIQTRYMALLLGAE